MTRIGFLGLGTMGAAMARRLVEAGHEVHVWNRSPGADVDLVQAGAIRATTVADVLSTGTVLSMLANDAAAESVFSAEALAVAPADTVHVNMATVSIATADRLAARHAESEVAYVAAPVLGRPNVAASGQLNIVAAGEATQLARVQPLLDVLGKRTWIVGTAPRAANLVKIGVNYNLIHTLQALAESITLVEHGGVDGSMFVDILTDAAYTGTVYTGYGRLIARKMYEPVAFSVDLGLKDLLLTEQAAEAHGVVLPTAPTLRHIFEQTLLDPGLARLDWSAVAEITRGLVHQASESE